MQEILQQFAGGGSTPGKGDITDHLDTMIQQAPNEHVTGAIGEALQGLGAQGFGSSVMEAAGGMSQGQKQGLMGMLTQAIEQGGGSTSNALSQSGAGQDAMSGNVSPSSLASLAQNVMQNHGGALQSVLGQHANNQGSSVLQLLGNPTVQRVGMHLAQRLLNSAG